MSTAPVFNGKPIQFVASSNFDAKFGGIETMLYIQIARSVLATYPVDMLVFEMNGHNQQVRLAGYDFNTNILNEETIAYTAKSLQTDTFWLKIDDYGDKYLGTFLFPEDY